MPALAMGLLGISWLASMRMQQHGVPAQKAKAPPVWQLLRRREVAMFFLSCFLMVAAHAALYVYYSLYLNQFGLDKASISWLWTLGVLAEIVFFYYQAPIFRRIPAERMLLACFAIAALRFALIGWSAPLLPLLLLAQVLHAFSFAAHNSSAITLLQGWFAGPLQARGQALYISISYGLGGTAGGLLMTAAWDSFGPRAVFYVAAGFCLAGAVAAWACLRWRRQDASVAKMVQA
jgi:PPP family 3-phenylpropionic acid transporter